MSVNMRDDGMIRQNIPTDTECYDEAVASQEEVYLEETEETLRAILISEDPFAYMREDTICPDCCVADSLDDELDHAAEELITGDSDDPPLSEDDVAEILRMTSNVRRLGA